MKKQIIGNEQENKISLRIYFLATDKNAKNPRKPYPTMRSKTKISAQ